MQKTNTIYYKPDKVLINNHLIACSKWEAKLGCDFYGNDFSNKSSSSVALCGDACVSLKKCTHFTFTPDGTCWMKTGHVNTNQAVRSKDNQTVCGILLISLKDEWENGFDSNISSKAFGKSFLK